MLNVDRLTLLTLMTIALLLAGCGQERTTVSVHTVTDNGVTIIARENRASQVVATQVFVRDGALVPMLAEAIDRMGSVDVVINNAGISIRHDFLDITPEEWDRIGEGDDEY